MIVKLKYFGLSTVMLNHEPQQVELPENATIEYLLNAVHDKDQDSVYVLLKAAVFLVNNSKVNKDYVLNDGDEILILNVLGGG
ncbi:MAG: MoaD/ThiS family protein [Sedimentibacter sp.]